MADLGVTALPRLDSLWLHVEPPCLFHVSTYSSLVPPQLLGRASPYFQLSLPACLPTSTSFYETSTLVLVAAPQRASRPGDVLGPGSHTSSSQPTWGK